MKFKLYFLTLSLSASMLLYPNLEEYTKGVEAFNKNKYAMAITHFNNATESTKTRVDAFLGLGQIYLIENKIQQAEKAFENAIKTNHTYGIDHKNMHTHIAKIYKQYHLEEKANFHLKRAKLLQENK